MKALFVLLLLAACAPSANSQILSDTTPILGVVKPPLADSAWQYDLSCGRLKADSLSPGKVHWFVADLIAHSKHHNLLGFWISPDTILLDLRFANDFTTIAHELMHYRLQHPGHPVDPFILCKLSPPPLGG